MPIVSYAVAWAMLFLVIYVASETAQRFFYDQTVDGLWWRSALTALPLAILLVHFPAQLDEMFTSTLHGTLLQAVCWVVLARFVLQYQTGHAFFFGLTCFFLFSWMVTMAVVSLGSWARPT
jgi:hypothetical protein